MDRTETEADEPYEAPIVERMGNAEEATFGAAPATPTDTGVFAARPFGVTS